METPVISDRQSPRPATAAGVHFPCLPVGQGNAKFQLEVSGNQDVLFFPSPSSWVPELPCGVTVVSDKISPG